MNRQKIIDELSNYLDITDAIPELGRDSKDSSHWFKISIALLVVLLPCALYFTIFHFYVIYKAPSIIEATSPFKIGLQLSLFVAIWQIYSLSKSSFKRYFRETIPYKKNIAKLHRIIMEPGAKDCLVGMAREQGRDDLYLRALNVAFNLPMNEMRYRENIVIHALKIVREQTLNDKHQIIQN
ncbi:hypothetical protein [Vibrio harveyi]|uniref:hypothetical protein n=1 Tax=Vibrio harveyi TaxID=669 RepID=UPI003CF3D005